MKYTAEHYTDTVLAINKTIYLLTTKTTEILRFKLQKLITKIFGYC